MSKKDKPENQFLPEILADRERLLLAMQAAGVGIWEVRLDTNTVSWDARCRELYGLADENLIPYQEVIQFIHPNDRDSVTTAVSRALSGIDGGKYDMRYRTIGADDGILRWVHFTGQAYFDDNGKAQRFAGIAQDITAYTEFINQSKQALEESEATLRSAMDLTGLATWSLDPATGKASYSDRMKDWLGVSVDERSIDEGVNALPEDERERVSLALKDALDPAKGGVYDLEYSIVNVQTGRKRIIRAQARTFFDLEGKPVKMMGTAQDFTPQRNIRMALEQQVQQRTEELDAANEELLSTNEELQLTNDKLAKLNESLTQSNEDLQQFAHVASHDLKEPVRKIKVYLSRVEADKDSQLSPDALFFMQRASLAADRMFSMINGVLSYSTINASDQQIDTIDINEMLRTIVVDLEEMLAQRSGSVVFSNLPVIQGASILIYQLFYNLLVNSLKFARPGVPAEIRITSSLIETDGENVAEITVADNGLGFDPKFSEKIFNTFTRLHSKDKYEGTGLGLALCKKIVQRHHGNIIATAERDNGALFTITLPLKQPGGHIF